MCSSDLSGAAGGEAPADAATELAPGSGPDPALEALFYAEVEPGLAQIGAALQRWRRGDAEAGLAVQRTLHTLKGGARFAGFTDFSAQCHALEGELAAALADGAGEAAAERLRRGLERLAESVAALRGEVTGRTLDQGELLEALWREPGEEAAPALDAGPGHRILGEAVAAELDEAGLEGAQRRLTPLEGLLPRLRRRVQAAAAECSRQVALELEGGAYELDAAVLERLAAPLEQLLVNAVVHGIEPPAARRAAGKPERGSLRLAARLEGGALVLAVSDDGAGLDLAALEQQAGGAGSPARGAALSNEEALGLIVVQGVSTRPAAGVEAGHGIGMDVVASRVRGLGGRLELDTRPPHGTTFTIRLPVERALSRLLEPREEAAAGRVLVVNDSRILRRIAVQLLERNGLGAVAAAGAAEAVEALREGPFEAVLLDLEVAASAEEAAGVLTRLAEALGLAPQAFVAVTTRAGDGGRLAEHGAAPGAVLLKPHDEGQLLAAVRRAIAAGRGTPPPGPEARPASELAGGEADGGEGDDGGGLGAQGPRP